jgi:hypothetical protein
VIVTAGASTTLTPSLGSSPPVSTVFSTLVKDVTSSAT